MERGSKILLMAAVAVLALSQVAVARDVKRCDITIQAGKTGTLVNDVQCGYHCIADPTVACVYPEPFDDPHCPLPSSECAPDAITLERNATLNLNGFTFTPAYQESTGITCQPGKRGRCTIIGPGTYAGGKQLSIHPNSMDLVLKNLSVNRMYDQVVATGWIHLDNVVMSQVGFRGGKGLRARNITFVDEAGIASDKDLYAEGLSSSVYASAVGTLHMRNSAIDVGSRLTGRDITLSNTSVKPDPGDDTVAIEFDAERRLVLRGSHVRGIKSGQLPKLVDSTCLQSSQADGVSTWGVCTND